jgi:hypothetical protein
MVAEEVPPVARHRVGVKRPREQTNRPVATASQVRPALDADPARSARRPTLETEGRGATPMARRPRGRPPSLPPRPPSLLHAAFPLAATSPTDVTNLTAPDIGFTHGMFGTLRSAVSSSVSWRPASVNTRPTVGGALDQGSRDVTQDTNARSDSQVDSQADGRMRPSVDVGGTRQGPDQHVSTPVDERGTAGEDWGSRGRGDWPIPR